MRLNVFVEEETYPLDIPDQVLNDASDFFEKMDRDMDAGWQMSKDFVENPNQTQRCQIVADRLLTSLMNGKTNMVMLMAGYILARLPGITGVQVDTEGDIMMTEMVYETDPQRAEIPPAVHKPKPAARRGLSEADARERAEKEISEVYKVGKIYRFAIYDARAGRWLEAPPADTEARAQQLRTQALDQRLRELLGN